MPRKLRVEYPGAIYHVMNRGDRREAIFRSEEDQGSFLQTLGEACGKTDWQVHAYCLMHNHFHLVVETPRANLVAGMKWFLGTYTARFNRRHQLFGHLFSGRYKSLLVDGSGNGYLQTVCEYVHLNPVRAKLLRAEVPLRQYRWSSFAEYLKTPSRRVAWLRVDRLLGEMKIPQDSATGRRAFERMMEERKTREEGDAFKAVRRGWCLGDEQFRRELLEQMSQKVGAHHYGGERQESGEAQAERRVVEELKNRGWSEAKLRQTAKSAPEKIQIARVLRKETIMTLRWIADRLKMGSWTHVSNLLARTGQ